MPGTPPRAREAGGFRGKRGPGALQRQGRATLLWALAGWVLFQAGLRLGIDLCWPQLRDPTFEIKARRLAGLIASSPEPPLTVIMVGSSVTSNAFKATSLEGLLTRETGRPALVLNMSSHGSGPLTELLWTRRLLRRGIRPDLVCIEFTPLFYNHSGPPVDAGRLPEYLLSAADLEIMERYGGDPDLRRKWWEGRWVPAYTHRLTILNYLAAPLVPVRDRIATWGGAIDERFWAPLEPRPPDELRAVLGRLRIQFSNDLRTFTPGESSLRAMEELLALLEQEGVPAAVVLAPQGPTVRGLYPKDDLAGLVREVARLSRRYGCPFIDAFDWLGEEMFADSIHPTVAGADLFSARLAREVLLPALGGSPQGPSLQPGEGGVVASAAAARVPNGSPSRRDERQRR